MKLPFTLTFLLMLLTISSATAAGTLTETWQVKWGNTSCVLVFSSDTASLIGTVKVQKPCGKTLRKVRSFAYSNANRTRVELFSRANAKGTLIGAFNRANKSNMAGMIGDGDSATMFLTATSSVSVTVTAGGNSGANTGKCVRYANNRTCAVAQDQKDPAIPAFKTIRMRSLSSQTIFPFSGGSGFAKDEKLARGECREIKKCEKAFNSTEHWCEVVLKDGFFTGWIKRQDDDWVYLRQGC